MRALLAISLIILSLSKSVEGVKRMKEYPFPGYEYAHNKPVRFMFPMIRPNTVGIYYGSEDHEKVAVATLEEHRIEMDVFKGDGFDGYMTIAYPQIKLDHLFIAQGSSIGALDIVSGRQMIDYRPKLPNNQIRNEYFGGRIIDQNETIVLSLFFPFVTQEKEMINSYALVIDNIKETKNTKTLRLNELSEETIFLGKKYSYYLECAGDINQIQYLWRVVDDNLDFVNHPLIPILDKQWEIFRSDAILISESQECAIARGYPKFPDDKYGPTQFQITPWIDNRPPVPIILPDSQRPSQYISKETFLLSPSGKWLFFVAAKPGLPSQGPEHYYLMYIDKTLPNYYLPPIEIEAGSEDFKVTWMQEPEGFVLWNGKHLRYWDLSKFDVGKFGWK